jgi:anti-sigma factor RsiW
VKKEKIRTKMLCNEFEDRLTDYLDGALAAQANKEFAEHALRCPVCHDLLSEVKKTLLACVASEAPIAGTELEARILLRTMPESAIACAEFEEYLTDYLDGFLVAPLYHRWERHAALCVSCSELPGAVVRSIGACYTYKQDELTVPAGLEARILQSTIGNVLPQEVRAPLKSRLIEWLRGALDPIVSPQLASVATMLLVSVFVLTNTVSTDGSVSGIYNASLQLAERTASNASKSSALPNGMKQLAGSVNDLMGGAENSGKGNEGNKNQSSSNQNGAPQGPKNGAPQSKPKPGSNEQNNR